MKLEQPRSEVIYVDNPKTLEQLVSDLAIQLEIGLDAERASGFRYSNSAYLIQLATKSRIYLVDPVAPNLPKDWNQTLAISLRKPTWILHSATQDLPCLAELDIYPDRLFDTELAARFLAVERFGLASLALEFLGIELAKEHSAADWSVRPLSDSMLNYAALDVDVLFDLREALAQRLSGLAKQEWLEQEFGRLRNFQAKPVANQPWRNLPGMSRVKDPRRQKIAMALWLERDQLARELDVAPGRLIPDRSIAAVVANPPKSKAELAKNREFHGRASRSKLDLWWRAVERSGQLELPEEVSDPNHIPNHRSWEKRFPEAFERLNVIRPMLVKKAEELQIATELLLTPDTLRRIAFQPASDITQQLAELGARPWQIEICLPLIQAGLEQHSSQSPEV